MLLALSGEVERLAAVHLGLLDTGQHFLPINMLRTD